MIGRRSFIGALTAIPLALKLKRPQEDAYVIVGTETSFHDSNFGSHPSPCYTRMSIQEYKEWLKKFPEIKHTATTNLP